MADCGLDKPIERYLQDVADRLRDSLGGELVGVYLGGSLVLDDYHAGASDVDVTVVAAKPVPAPVKHHVANTLRHETLPCPAKGLDLVAYAIDQLAPLRRSPAFELSLVTGATWKDEVEWGGPYAGGLIDVAIVRQSGKAVLGRAPASVIDEVPAQWIAEELRAAVAWHRGRIHHPFHDPLGINAVLNAARAWRYLETGILGSKTEGARWLASHRHQSLPVLATAAGVRPRQQPLRATDVLQLLDAFEARFGDTPSTPSAV